MGELEDDFYRRVLSLDVLDPAAAPPLTLHPPGLAARSATAAAAAPASVAPPRALPARFRSLDEYEDSFGPLLMRECFDQLRASLLASLPGSLPDLALGEMSCRVLDVRPGGPFHFVRLQLGSTGRAGRSCGGRGGGSGGVGEAVIEGGVVDRECVLLVWTPKVCGQGLRCG